MRTRLIDAINQPEVPRVTLITAPAGFGKSTLAGQWARDTIRLVVWVSLHSESNTPDRFLEDLQLSLEIETRFKLAGDAIDEPTLSAILARLRAASASKPVTIVLDDYHLIENRDVHRVANALIHELPPAVSIMILSRALPPLALGRLRVEGQVREITEVDLRFDQRDVATLVSMESDRELSRAQITRLVERTDGWIAGIRLAILAVLQAEDEQIDNMIGALSAHQWLDDYIVEEVLSSLPNELREFVLRTASLRVLEPELCDAVLGISNSASLIDELARRLVFVRRDTRSGMGVAYHALFAECVDHIAKRHIPIGELQEQHMRAAAWLERHERAEVALDHAMFSEDWPAVLRILRKICQPLWDRDLHDSLLHWIERVPIQQLRLDHELLYWYIHKLFSVGRFREAMVEMEVAEPLWQASGKPEEIGFIMGCQAFKAVSEGDAAASLQFSYRALRYLPTHNYASRMRSWTNVCGGEFSRGNDEVATAAYQQAEYCRRFLPAEQRWWTMLTEIVRINQYALRGNLPTAERLLQMALERLPHHSSDAAGKIHFRLAAIYLEWNELDRALAEVDRFIQDPERFPWQTWYIEAWLIAARVELASGRRDRAQATLNRLFEMVEERGASHTADRAHALQAQLQLEQGEILLASAWGDSLSSDLNAWSITFGETDPNTVLIQLRIMQGRHEEALLLTTTRIAEGRRCKWFAELVPLYVLQAAAFDALGRRDEAIEALRSALQLGMPGRFNRSFFPHGIDLLSFYEEAKTALEANLEAYVDQLLDQRSSPQAMRAEPAEIASRGATPGELLSPREREILTLVRDGLSSRDIAERLFIGESTIKKHLTRTFFKLNVSNRTAAVIRAQELRLLA